MDVSATPRLALTNYYLTPEFLTQTRMDCTEVKNMPGKGYGVCAKKHMARKYVVCYYPSVVRRVHPDRATDYTYAFGVLTPSGRLSKTSFCDLPSDSEEYLSARWRNKPVIGHLCNEPSPMETANAHLELPTLRSPRVGDSYYVPVVVDRPVAPTEEILVTYNDNYDRSGYSALI